MGPGPNDRLRLPAIPHSPRCFQAQDAARYCSNPRNAETITISDRHRIPWNKPARRIVARGTLLRITDIVTSQRTQASAGMGGEGVGSQPLAKTPTLSPAKPKICKGPFVARGVSLLTARKLRLGLTTGSENRYLRGHERRQLPESRAAGRISDHECERCGGSGFSDFAGCERRGAVGADIEHQWWRHKVDHDHVASGSGIGRANHGGDRDERSGCRL